MIQFGGKARLAGDCLKYVDDPRDMILKRIYRVMSFEAVTLKVGDFGAFASNLGRDIPPQFIARLLQEQNSVRGTLTRIEAIPPAILFSFLEKSRSF